jgi:predicted ATPase
LFTDVEGSTARWEADPDGMRAALAAHDRILREAVEFRGGWVFKRTGDGMYAAFSSPRGALDAAVAAQELLELPVRMGIATGEAELRDDDYFGAPLNLAARLMTAGHGGQVLVASATAALVGDAGLLDLGDQLLDGLRAPVRVFQLGEGVFPQLRTLASAPSNLPAELSGFVGRDEELAEVAAAVEVARLVTVTGAGGVGKTRVALRAAANLLGAFRDGVWLVELAPLADPAGLVDVIARALGITERLSQPLTTTVHEVLRGRQLLVVIDNCEHLDDAVGAWAAAVLAACPKVSVLATSRRRLGVRGERVVALNPLALPALGASVGEIAGVEAVRLFVERAVESKGSFALSDANAEEIARLVRLLDGIPLAIELAAARVRSRTPAELAELFGRSRTTGGYEPLRRALDWSYGLLSDLERVALDRAAVFAGGFDLAAAEAVLGVDPIDPPQVIDLLDGLVEHSLVIADDQDGTTRYRLLETIRQYGREHLDTSDQTPTVRAAHAAHYRGFAEEAGGKMRGPGEAAWVPRVEQELANLGAAVAWAVDEGHPDVAIDIVTALVYSGLRFPDIFSWAEPIVTAPSDLDHPRYAVALLMTAQHAVNTGRYDAGVQACRAAVAALERPDVNDRTRLDVVVGAENVLRQLGLLAEAAELTARSWPLARQVGEPHDIAWSLATDALARWFKGDVDGVLEQADEAMQLAREGGFPSGLAFIALSAGVVRVDTAPLEARQLFAEGAAAARTVGFDYAEAHNLGFQAWTHVKEGDWRTAAVLANTGLGRMWRSGNPNAMRGWLGQAMLILAALDDPRGAAVLHGATASVERALIPNGQIEPRWDETEPTVRHNLGDSEFNSCVARGATMTIDEIASFALAHLEAVAKTSN